MLRRHRCLLPFHAVVYASEPSAFLMHTHSLVPVQPSFPLVTLGIMLLLVVTTVGKARGLSFLKLFSVCDMMTAVMGTGRERAMFQRRPPEAHP